MRMGGIFSSEPQFPQHVMNALPYMCKRINSDDGEYLIKLDKTAVKVKSSTITTTFPNGKSDGLFATKHIPQNLCFMKAGTPISFKINDYVDLGSIMEARNDEEMYAAWKSFFNSYYDLDQIKSKVNVIMLYVQSEDSTYMCALRPIEPGDELIRCYGFSTWLGDLDLIGEYFGGYSKFFDEFIVPMKGDDPLRRQSIERHSFLKEKFGENAPKLA